MANSSVICQRNKAKPVFSVFFCVKESDICLRNYSCMIVFTSFPVEIQINLRKSGSRRYNRSGYCELKFTIMMPVYEETEKLKLVPSVPFKSSVTSITANFNVIESLIFFSCHQKEYDFSTVRLLFLINFA